MHFNNSTDEEILDAVPDFLSVGLMLKATPASEGEDRFVYLEASNEKKDQQNEIVLSKALADSADYFLTFGNVDIDHLTQIGAKRGIPDYLSFEIGRPVSVRIENGRTFVKAQIYSGDGPAAEKANMFWSSVTDLTPPARWYPSVGGAVMGKEIVVGPNGDKHAVINKVRWSNLAVSRTPVNANVPTVSTAAFGPLAKSWGAMLKGLEAGYGTDSASLTGGAALRVQSLDKQLMSYWDFRDQFSNAIQSQQIAPGDVQSQSALVAAAMKLFSLPQSRAARYVQRFLTDLQLAISTKESQ